MRGRSKRAWAGGVIAALLLSHAPVRADDASEAQLQFELGLEMYQQRRHLEAVERFLASYRLVPNANVAFNVAQTYSLLERRADAYNWCETVLGGEAADNVRELATRLRDRLAPRVAVFEVTSEPPGAEIFVDRVDLGARGTAPRRIAVDPGARRVILRLPAHREASIDATATAGTVTPVRGELAPIVARVAIASVPAGATLTLEAVEGVRALGVAPLEVELPVGTHRVHASLPGHREATAEVTVAPSGEARSLEITLEAQESSRATLTVTGTPPGARVRLGDADLGTIPMTRADLSPGRTTVEVSAPDLEPYRATVLLEAGGVTRVAVRLHPVPSWSWPVLRWVLYGTAGAAVIAGSIFGVLALSVRDAFDENPTRADHDAVPRWALAADVALGTGIVIGVGTLVLDLILSPPRSSEGRVRIER